MAAEIEAHLDGLTERNIAAGMSPEAARFAALREFGGVEQIKERCRDEQRWIWLSQFFQDLNYGLRSLRKHLGFTLAATLTLAIGIGVNVTVFAFINDLILRRVAPGRPDEPVALHTRKQEGDRGYRAFNYSEFEALRSAREVFSDLTAMTFASTLMGDEESAQRRIVCLVAGNYFSMLNVQPLRGRFFTPEEASPTANATVVVASYELWRRMGAREEFVGSQLRIDGVDYTVVGIAPASFGGLQWSIGPDAWLPWGRCEAMSGLWGTRPPNFTLKNPQAYVLELFGYLRDGVTLESAKAALGPLSARLNELGGAGASERRELVLTRVARTNMDLTWPTDESGLNIYAFGAFGMTLTVLVIACLNVANMLLGRSVSRQKEIAIRLCLGATRGRVVRQLLVEGLILALLGGAVGLLLNRWSNEALLQMGRERAGMYSMHLRTTVEWPLVAATFGLCLIATMLFALVPALRATRRNLVDDLKQHGGEPTGTGRWNRWFSLRQCLVMTQVALSVTLLFTAGLLVRGVVNAEQDRGFETHARVVANLDYGLAKTPKDEIPARQKALLTRLAALPGVESVALASSVPYNFQWNIRPVFPIGTVKQSSGGVDVDGKAPAGSTLVSHGYFQTMGIKLLRGRDFTEAEAMQDGGRRVAIIDESLGRTLFGSDNPVGRHVALSKRDVEKNDLDRAFEVIGVVRSPREDAFQSEKPFARIYLPAAKVPGGFADTYVQLKLSGVAAGAKIIDTIRQEIRTMDPKTPILACEPLADFVAKNLNVWTLHFLSTMFVLFGIVAVVLAVIGVYGVKAYLVARRTREMGIRIAIGARPADVLGLLLRQSASQTSVGVLVGLGLALLVGRLLSKMLYRINPTDTVVLLGASLLVAAVATAATFVPALRATRVSPTEALRTE